MCFGKDRPRADELELSSGKRKCQAHFQFEQGATCTTVSREQPHKRRCAIVTALASSYQFQINPEGDGNEPRGGSELTGSGIRAGGMVSNVGLCNETCTVSEHDGWRKRSVRVMRLLELLFLPKKRAPFEDLDPRCWSGSCKLMVEDFQDREEEKTSTKWMSLSRRPGAEEGNLHFQTGEERRLRGPARGERTSVCWTSVCLRQEVALERNAGRLPVQVSVSMSSMTVQDTPWSSKRASRLSSK